MRLLLDTNILILLLGNDRRTLPKAIGEVLRRADTSLRASVVSLWEVAIKHRLGKLPLSLALPGWSEALAHLNIDLVPLEQHHVLQQVEGEIASKDPFDRILLAICAADDLRLVTLDRALAAHPLAWRPGAPA